MGVCEQLSDCGLHREHASRPRPLHRQGLRCRRHDEGDLRAQGRAVPRQGRLHAHRRHDQGHAGRQRHRRRRAAHRGRRGHCLQVARQPQRQRRLRRRRQRQSGHRVRGHEHGRGAASVPAIFVMENNGYSEHTGAAYAVGSGDLAGRARGLRHAGRTRGWRGLSRRVRRHGPRGERVRRNGEGPSTIEATITRFYGHFEGDPQNYRAKDEVARLARDHGLPEALSGARRGRRALPPRRSMPSTPRCWRSSMRAVAEAKAARLRRSKPICTPTSTFSTDFNANGPPTCRSSPCATRSTRPCTRRWRATNASSFSARTCPAAPAAPPGSAKPPAAYSASPRGCCRRFGEGRVIDTPISESAIVGAAAGRGAGGSAARGRTHVRRLRRRVHGSDLQSDREVSLHVRRQEHLSGRDPHGHGRRNEHGPAAFADDLFAADRGARPESGHALQCATMPRGC